MMILTGLSSGLTGNKIIQGFNFCWILVFLVFMLLHNFCNDRQWGLIKYIAAAFQAVFGAIGCIAEPFMDIADYMRNERMDSDHMGSESEVGDKMCIRDRHITIIIFNKWQFFYSSCLHQIIMFLIKKVKIRNRLFCCFSVAYFIVVFLLIYVRI